MKKPPKPVLRILIISAIVMISILIMQFLEIYYFEKDIALLFPKGWVGLEQRNLLLIIQVLMLLIIVPVYLLTFFFSWRYREHNPDSVYDPDLVDNVIAEFVWWGLPCLMMIFVGGITWIKTYELDPYKQLKSENKPLTIQVVALQWKWLFVYPEEKIATINSIHFPVNRPLRFLITADAPMNSFWIPSLGGQIYAMPGMRTELNLIANEAGSFRGYSANISGEGFAGMTFQAVATSEEEYKQWIAEAANSEAALNFTRFQQLAEPSKFEPIAHYKLEDEQLFHRIIMQFMEPPTGQE